MSSMQTARVLPEGTYRFFVGGGGFRTPSVSPSDPNKVGYPYLEGGARFGFTPGWDIGLKYTLPGMFTGDVKVILVEDDAFAFALGAGVGYLALKDTSVPSASSTNQTQELVDILFPTYLSYDFTPGLGVYASPRFILRWSTTTSQKLLGGALGFRFGNTVGVMVEAGGAADLSSEYRQYHVGLGFFFGAVPTVPVSLAVPEKN